jgi:hypothetical protein
MTPIATETLGHTLKPLCSRDDHVMKYEEKGIRWKDPAEGSEESVAALYVKDIQEMRH